MTTELFQWVVVVLLLLIWRNAARSNSLTQQLAHIQSQIIEIKNQIASENGIGATANTIARTLSEIQQRMKGHFPSDAEIEAEKISRFHEPEEPDADAILRSIRET